MTSITAAQAKALAEAFATITGVFVSLSNSAVEGTPTTEKAPAKKAVVAKSAPVAKAAPKRVTKAVEVEEEDDDDDEDIEDDEDEDDELDGWTGEGMDEAELRAYARKARIADLRAILSEEHELTDAEIAKLSGKQAVTDKFVELVLALNEGDSPDYEDEDDEDDEEDDDDLEEDDDYDSMSLRELRAAAKAEGYSAERTKGADRDALIALLRGELEDEEDDEDEEEDDLEDNEFTADADDEDDDEDEDDEEEYDPDTMTDAELRKLARDNGIKLKRGATRAEIIATLFD